MKLEIIFILSVILSVIFTLILRFIAKRLNIVDKPDKDRKIHKGAIPLLGGVAIFFSFFAMLFIAREDILARGLSEIHLLSFLLAR